MEPDISVVRYGLGVTPGVHPGCLVALVCVEIGSQCHGEWDAVFRVRFMVSQVMMQTCIKYQKGVPISVKRCSSVSVDGLPWRLSRV